MDDRKLSFDELLKAEMKRDMAKIHCGIIEQVVSDIVDGKAEIANGEIRLKGCDANANVRSE